MSSSPNGTSLFPLSLGHGLAAMVHVHLCHRSYRFTRSYCKDFVATYDHTERQILQHSLRNLNHSCDVLTEVLALLRRLSDRSQQRLQQGRRLSGLARAKRRSSTCSLHSDRSGLDGWSSEEDYDLLTLRAHAIDAADLERIREMYKDSRAGRESVKMASASFLTSIDRTLLDMHYSVIASTLLGSVVAVRYFVSTSMFARYGSWMFFYGRWVRNKISSLFLPRTSLVPWGLAPNTSSNSMPAPSGGSFIPTLLLPLLPSVCLATMHFSTACLSRWAIIGMRANVLRQLRTAGRSITILELLSYRDKRLNWIINEIRAYEQIQDDGGAYESDGSTSTSASDHNERLTSTLRSWQVQAPPPVAILHPHYKSITKRKQKLDVRLEDLDMVQFLSNPIERDRILRMELQSMADEQRMYLEIIDVAPGLPRQKP